MKKNSKSYLNVNLTVRFVWINFQRGPFHVSSTNVPRLPSKCEPISRTKTYFLRPCFVQSEIHNDKQNGETGGGVGG